MKSKKLIAMGLAVVMTAALAVPALAANTVITGMYQEIQIDVDVSPVGTAVINPYGMPVKAMYKATPEAEPVAVDTLKTAGKIATQPLVAVNKCDVTLDVGATVSGTVKGSLMLASKDVSTLKTKSAVVYLECKQDTTLDNTNLSSTDADQPIEGVKGADLVAAFNDWDATSYDFGTDAVNAGKILVGTTAKTKANLCTMAAAEESATPGDPMEPQKGSFMLFRLGGDVVQAPTDAWTAKDGVVVNVAFTFTPAAPREGGAITGTAAVAASKLVATVAAPAGVTFSANARYVWAVVEDNGTAIDTATDNGDGTCDFTSSGTLAAGTVKVTCTVTDMGIQYVTPATELTVTP